MTLRQAEKLRKGKNRLDYHEKSVGTKQKTTELQYTELQLGGTPKPLSLSEKKGAIKHICNKIDKQ